jgi:GH24 family phage-related lysozyme (muramidase)
VLARSVRGVALVILLIGAGALISVAAASAKAVPPPPKDFPLDDATEMVVKYYEGIPTNFPSPRPKKLSNKVFVKYAQLPSLAADRAVLYNDSSGNCTVGWGHLVRYSRCNTKDYATYGNPFEDDGWTFADAQSNLGPDIRQNALDVLDKCIRVDLTAGEVRALVGVLYQKGPSLIATPLRKRDPKTGKTKLVPCQGKLALLLNSKQFKLIPAAIQKAQPFTLYRDRAAWEIWDFTDGKGKGGLRRPAAWSIQTEIEPSSADATITITPTGTPDQLAGVTPAKKSVVCASTESKPKAPQKHCGEYYIDEEVKITAKPSNHWNFDGWEQVDDDTGGARDVCAGQGVTCTVKVKDQLVRAIAVFSKCTASSSTRDATAAASATACPITATYSGNVSASYHSDLIGDDDLQQISFGFSETGTFAPGKSDVIAQTLAITAGKVSESDPDHPSLDCTGTLQAAQTSFPPGQHSAGPIIVASLGSGRVSVTAAIPLGPPWVKSTGDGDCAGPIPFVGYVPWNAQSSAAWMTADQAIALFTGSSPPAKHFDVDQSYSQPIIVGSENEGTDSYTLNVTDTLTETSCGC